MTGKVIVVGNRKGGVGKTTTVVALSQALKERRGLRVVAVDLDPQSSLTTALADDLVDGRLKDLMVEKLLRTSQNPRKNPLFDGQVSALLVRPDVPLGLVPCSEELWDLENDLNEKIPLFQDFQVKIAKNWDALLKQLKVGFDVVVVDTAPGRTIMQRFALAYADLVIVPCDTTAMSIRGVPNFYRELHKTDPRILRKTRLLWTRFQTSDILNIDLESRVKELKGLESTLPLTLVGDGIAFGSRFAGLPLHASLAKGSTKTDPIRLDSLYTGAARLAVNAMCDAVTRELDLKSRP